ncbi:hypothetical protein FRC02_000541 [Tulasnella sp. 418]|nr:hypothetical protein FRC02_000541 [Tulasnella sp. 418]
MSNEGCVGTHVAANSTRRTPALPRLVSSPLDSMKEPHFECEDAQLSRGWQTTLSDRTVEIHIRPNFVTCEQGELDGTEHRLHNTTSSLPIPYALQARCPRNPSMTYRRA